MIYFIFSPDDPQSLVKIGYTKGSIAIRLAALQTGIPFRLSLIAAEKGDRSTEIALHRRFRESRIHGEWFLPTEDLRSYLRTVLGTPFDQSIEDTLANPHAIASDAAILGWTTAEVIAGLTSLRF